VECSASHYKCQGEQAKHFSCVTETSPRERHVDEADTRHHAVDDSALQTPAGIYCSHEEEEGQIIVGTPTPSFLKNPSSVRLIRLELKAANRAANNPALFPQRSFAKK